MENKKKLIAGIVGGIVGLALIGAVAYLYINLDNQRKENKAMQELAELDKKEMENEYQQFANQYSEMRMQISNDSIIAQLTAEQERTEKLLKELKETKTNDAREIARLKKELATVRAILRNYVIEIDSLNRLNHNLTEENSRIKGQYNPGTSLANSNQLLIHLLVITFQNIPHRNHDVHLIRSRRNSSLTFSQLHVQKRLRSRETSSHDRRSNLCPDQIFLHKRSKPGKHTY